MTRSVTVCSACLRASCWQGHFYCDDAKSAGTVDKPVSELQSIAREHPSYWFRDEDGILDVPAYMEFQS